MSKNRLTTPFSGCEAGYEPNQDSLSRDPVVTTVSQKANRLYSFVCHPTC